MELSSITMTDWLTIVAIIIGPIAAVLVSLAMQRHAQHQSYKFHLIATFLQNRHSVLSEDHVRAFNAIDLVFAKHKNVRQHWEQFMQMRNTQGISQEDLGKKYNQLIEAMVKAAGYGRSLSYIDVSRVFYPGDQQPQPDPKSQELMDLMLRVFRRFDEKLASEQRPLGDILSGLLGTSRDSNDLD